MDFRYRLDGPRAGEFWLDHCGALMDAEPMGEEFVHLMCHDIEDPTFDATAAAANPHTQIRPIHRPPRVPADRSPHCHWRVTIDDAFEAFGQHHNQALVESSLAASIGLVDPGPSAESGGWDDLSGPFDPDFQLEDLSHRTLALVCQEIAVQSHLLARAFILTVHEHFGLDDAVAAGRNQCTGIAGLTAERLLPTLGITTGGTDAVAKVFQFHPLFLPRTYVDLRLDVHRMEDSSVVRVAIGACPALQEGDDHSWFSSMRPGEVHPAIESIAHAAHSGATVDAAPPLDDERLAWSISVPNAPPDGAGASEHPTVSLAKISTGATTVFIRRRPVRV